MSAPNAKDRPVRPSVNLWVAQYRRVGVVDKITLDRLQQLDDAAQILLVSRLMVPDVDMTGDDLVVAVRDLAMRVAAEHGMTYAAAVQELDEILTDLRRANAALKADGRL